MCYLSCLDIEGTERTDFILHAAHLKRCIAQSRNIIFYNVGTGTGCLYRLEKDAKMWSSENSKKSAFVLHPCRVLTKKRTTFIN